MLDLAGKSEPTLGEILSLPANQLFRDCPGLQSTIALTDGQYMAYHHHVLSETYSLPTQDLSEDQVQMEPFAVKSLAKLIKSTESAHPAETFVLSHLDLRCHNIIITGDLHVRGIIDWEFSGIVPRYLFTPPPWLTGHDSSAAWACPPRAPVLHCQLYPEFLEVLEEKSTSDSNCAKLWEE
ncbi:APH domain-containing protein [Fusarium sp. LHS14.1]|nr:APH domain-containing protein [Fusarium sp. LHS14.1]